MEVLARRERVRSETTAEIKRRAWALMAEAGADALSLRAVARQMGMASSALYRYFSSRDDLLTALIVDGFTSLGDALRTAHDAARQRSLPAVPVWLEVGMAYRAWARENRTEYALIYSTSIPNYQGTEETTASSVQVGDVLLDVMAGLLAEGRIDLDRIEADLDAAYTRQLTAWSGHGGHDLSPAALAAAMHLYATLHGLLHLEMNGHFPPPLQDSDAMFASTLRAATAALGPVASRP